MEMHVSNSNTFENILKNPRIVRNLKYLKIAIIVFAGYSALVNANPFFENGNPYYYGINSILYSQGIFEYSNFLIEDYGSKETIPPNMLLTNHNSTIPMSGTGLIFGGAIFYLIGGYYGILFFSPIMFVLLLIFVERFSTKIFGNYVGLFTLTIISFSNHLFRNIIEFQTESLFVLLFCSGVFFLIYFLKFNKRKFLLFSTITFILSSYVKIIGLISFPLEITIIFGITISGFILNRYKNQLSNFSNRKQILKNITIVLLPWMIFFIAYFSYYDYFFDDGLTNYGKENNNTIYDTSIQSIFEIESKDAENIKQYSKYVLPYLISGGYNTIQDNFEDVFGSNWIGFLGLGIVTSGVTISVITKEKRKVIITFSIFTFTLIWFLSSITPEFRADLGVAGRYMFPGFIFATMILGWVIKKVLTIKDNAKKIVFKKIFLGVKSVLLIGIILFLIITISFSNQVTNLVEDGLNFDRPYREISNHIINSNELEQDDIILTKMGPRAIEYNVSPLNTATIQKINDKDSVEFLKSIINSNHNVYAFKIPFNNNEKIMIEDLVEEHGIVLKEYSETFCKVYLKNSTMIKSDDVCINNESIR